MCDLIGVVQSTASLPSRELFQASVARLRHRGPDAMKVFWAPELGVALGHTRLSIIDPGEQSDQPFISQRSVLAFNGEIYNYRELRSELMKLGAIFRTGGDTEIISVGYDVWGRDVFRRLRGMYAIALFDKASGEVHLARDLFGIKPLYVAPLPDGGIAFASEIKAIAAFTRLRLSFDAFVDSSMWGFPWSLRSAYDRVAQLAPRSCATLRNQDGQWSATYWASKPPLAAAASSPPTATPDVRDALEDSVAHHLLADVPIAIALSGGLDSSVIAAIAARKRPDLVAFTATYADTDDPEVEHARILWEMHKIEHRIVRLPAPRLEETLRRVCEHLEEPFANVNSPLSYQLGQAVQAAGFKVVLIGEGSDEVFAGYPWNRFARAPEAMADPRTLFDAYMRRRGASRFKDVLRQDRLSAAEARVAGQRRIFVKEFEQAPGTGLNRFLHIERYYQMQFSQLHRVDKMFIAHGIEARVPYLYDPVLQASVGLSDDAKIAIDPDADGLRAEKIALAEAAVDLLPRQIVERRKFGAGGTVNLWETPLMKELLALFDAVTHAQRYEHAREITSDFLDWDRIRTAKLDAKGRYHLVLTAMCADLFAAETLAVA